MAHYLPDRIFDVSVFGVGPLLHHEILKQSTKYMVLDKNIFKTVKNLHTVSKDTLVVVNAILHPAVGRIPY